MMSRKYAYASLLLTFSLATLTQAGCGSDSGGGGGPNPIACRQKADANNNPDCAGHAGGPRKLDCSNQDQTDQAVAAGCVAEKPGGNDVCCPTTVTGQSEQAATLACTEPADTLTDSSCAGTNEARKLDCVSKSEQDSALAKGCRPEQASDPTDFDVCCPISVRGVH